MRLRPLFLSTALFAIVLSGGAAADVQWTNCDTHYRSLDLAPIGPGPLELTKVHCQRSKFDFKNASIISPDGLSIAYLEGTASYGEERKVLHVSPLHLHNGWTSYPLNMGPLWQFSSGDRSGPAIAWDTSSSALWAATREQTDSERISSPGLQPALARKDGSLELLPPLRNEAGPLDGLLWVGGDGLAVAYFGARGGFRQRPSPNPIFAIVDAKRGAVLDTVRFDDLGFTRDSYRVANLNHASATKLENGKVRALLSGHRGWVVWTQNEVPRPLPDPYPEQRHSSKFTISPDGSSALISRFACDGGILDNDRGASDNNVIVERAPRPTLCKPVETDVAALHDLRTGRQIWRIRSTVYAPSQARIPAISPDGRYALIGLQSEKFRSIIALVSMKDGTILQRLLLPSNGDNYSLGFLHGGRAAWVHIDNVTLVYDVRSDG